LQKRPPTGFQAPAKRIAPPGGWSRWQGVASRRYARYAYMLYAAELPPPASSASRPTQCWFEAFNPAEWLVFAAIFALLLHEGLAGVQFALANRRMLSGAIWPGGILGAAVGVMLWLIARPDINRRS
jgi:hypothetical protein